LNGPDGFLAVALGIPTPAQGPAIPSIGASTVTGVYDGVDTIVGEWAVSITMGGSGPQGGLLLSIAIVIPYEAVRIPE